jgi:hypothetical protein
MPALTGDVTTTAGSLTTAIGSAKVTDAMLAGSIALSKLATTGSFTFDNAYANFRTSDCPGGWACNLFVWDISADALYYSTMSQRSDKRLKTAIEPMSGSSWLTKLYALKPVQYQWLNQNTAKGIQFGLIAQDVEDIWPELVSTANDPMKTKSVNYINLIAPLIQAVKEMKTTNDAQAEHIKTLEENIIVLKAEINLKVK